MKPVIIIYTFNNTANGRGRISEMISFCRGALAANPDAIDFSYSTSPPKITIHTAHPRFFNGLLIQFGSPTSITVATV